MLHILLMYRMYHSEKLLYPHIKQVLTINFLSRYKTSPTAATLIGNGGFVTIASPLSYDDIYELFDVVLQDWTPDEWNVPKHIEKNGVDSDTFPFPYDAVFLGGHIFCTE